MSDVGVRPGGCGDRGVDGGEGLRVRVRDSSKESGSSCRRGIVGYQAVGKRLRCHLVGIYACSLTDVSGSWQGW